MKQFLFLTIFFAFASTSVIAQSAPVAQNIKATIVENSLNLTWNDANASEAGSWEVQASTQGKEFATIGFVWGEDPKGNGSSFAFKQKMNNVKSSYKYFRVIYVASADKAFASNTIKVSK